MSSSSYNRRSSIISSTAPYTIPARPTPPYASTHSLSNSGLIPSPGSFNHSYNDHTNSSYTSTPYSSSASGGSGPAGMPGPVPSQPNPNFAIKRRDLVDTENAPFTSPNTSALTSNLSACTSHHNNSTKEPSTPTFSRKFVARRISEGETGRLKEELRCEACGKGYKHMSSFVKHLWEHTPEWNVTSKLLISKHQQVQLLEAASILVSINENENDNSESGTSHINQTESGPPTPSSMNSVDAYSARRPSSASTSISPSPPPAQAISLAVPAPQGKKCLGNFNKFNEPGVISPSFASSHPTSSHMNRRPSVSVSTSSVSNYQSSPVPITDSLFHPDYSLSGSSVSSNSSYLTPAGSMGGGGAMDRVPFPPVRRNSSVSGASNAAHTLVSSRMEDGGLFSPPVRHSALRRESIPSNGANANIGQHPSLVVHAAPQTVGSLNNDDDDDVTNEEEDGIFGSMDD
ncbi:hypothetical protein NADFUDRAFT_44108 [Nadsonia fulvescens var. elongata DSM 6958]|uniref:C2H2-type domain-containing protein n=1 Tax=Nadsonia fulvescens var. elongata DSM 6958 TaxID=857566 RepID=A0A1E3PE11_9ASCO|nr:hypothetical protein NADFUDRAFT_44108 [Nadsonia fulvescens var. elongata DSM 6958]